MAAPRMIGLMKLSPALAWLVDEAGASTDADRFLAELGARLIDDGVPLAGGALTLSSPHPIIARRTWLWRSETGAVIEALGFAAGLAGAELMGPPGDNGRGWLAGLGGGAAHEDIVGPGPDAPALSWIGPQPFTTGETGRLREAARFAGAPLAALSARATFTAALEAYLGRRTAERVLAGPLRRGVHETIRAALVCADLRGFTALSEAAPPAEVIAALDAWFDRIAGAVHAFGGEVLKFLGDGMLAIFPVAGGSPGAACDAALRAISAARAGMAHLDAARTAGRPPASALRRGDASRRDPVGQYRRRRSAGLHRHRPGRQSRQPARGALPAARPGGPRVGRGRGRNRGGANPARHARAPWHRAAMRRLHRAGRLRAEALGKRRRRRVLEDYPVPIRLMQTPTTYRGGSPIHVTTAKGGKRALAERRERSG